MNRVNLLKEVTKIFKDILDNENVILEENTQATDIDEWDSLTHIQLVVAVEKHFKIRFSSKEIQKWKNIGELLNCVEEKI
jgi:acyl carrier protein